ncbi:hypothetical protein [Protaetiibacter larvae]|uniref:Exo-alpha-sialidase n=1 Tax=Protaetiibacter larvae TaxID=2592654 RepID=A0A5C1Y6S8_9MICO|nr:hypothetical protein [Protaetiibacter larvae]QEO09511.1 hypothetical protein FLP23_05495 [Protaetiibacter larvae]
MAAKRARRSRGEFSGRVGLAIAAIVAFLAVDAVLVLAAINASRGVESSTVYLEPNIPPQPSITPTPTTPPVVGLPVGRVLAGAGESAVWRASAGSCTGGVAPALQTSSDAGATWTDRSLASYDVRQILVLWVRDVNYGEAVVRIGDDCRLAGIRSFTGGRFWEESEGALTDTVALDLDAPGDVLVDGEAVAAPCPDAVQAVPAAESVFVLCGDGSLFGRADGEWTPQAPQPGAVALVAEGAAPEVVFSGPEDCPLALGLRDEVGELAPRVCAPTAAVPGATVAVAIDGRTVVWAGDFFGAL